MQIEEDFKDALENLPLKPTLKQMQDVIDDENDDDWDDRPTDQDDY
jgi:hypothetical protein